MATEAKFKTQDTLVYSQGSQLLLDKNYKRNNFLNKIYFYLEVYLPSSPQRGNFLYLNPNFIIL